MAPALTFNDLTFCTHSVFVCFVWICEQTAIISTYSINWVVCITEPESVYCAVRAASWSVIQVNFRPKILNSQWGTCWADCVAPVDKSDGRACWLWAGEQVNRRAGEQVSVTLRLVDQKRAGMKRNIDSCNSHSVFRLPASTCRTRGCWTLQSWQLTTDRLLVSVRPTADQELPSCRSDRWSFFSIFPAIVLFNFWSLLKGGAGWRSWLGHGATSRKLPGSIPDGVIGIFHWLKPSGPVIDSTCNINDYQSPEGKADRYEGLTNFPPSYAHCLEILGKVPEISFPL